jgi:hypothetical protein
MQTYGEWIYSSTIVNLGARWKDMLGELHATAAIALITCLNMPWITTVYSAM